jgi:hypothetical protein
MIDRHGSQHGVMLSYELPTLFQHAGVVVAKLIVEGSQMLYLAGDFVRRHLEIVDPVQQRDAIPAYIFVSPVDIPVLLKDGYVALADMRALGKSLMIPDPFPMHRLELIEVLVLSMAPGAEFPLFHEYRVDIPQKSLPGVESRIHNYPSRNTRNVCFTIANKI